MYHLKIFLGLHGGETRWQNNIHEGEQLINTIHKYEGNVPGTGAVSFLCCIHKKYFLKVIQLLIEK